MIQIKHERILELYELTAGDSVGSAYLKMLMMSKLKQIHGEINRYILL